MASSVIGPISSLVNSDLTYGNSNAAQAVSTPQISEPTPTVKAADETPRKDPDSSKPKGECQTCKHRKYVDGSNENVSFKSPQHVAPESAGAKVRAHEQEHVSNAYTKASQNNAKVISAVVALHTAVCPECGRSYVAGGTTTTKIKYYGDNNAYHKGADFANATNFNGNAVDIKG